MEVSWNKYLITFIWISLLLLVHIDNRSYVKQQTIADPYFELLLDVPDSDPFIQYGEYIKQKLGELRIEVKIRSVPVESYHGHNDYTNLYRGLQQPFEMALTRFVRSMPSPDFIWNYHSSNTLYNYNLNQFYPLHDPNWQKQQYPDTGIETQEVDRLIEEIEYELDPIKKHELVDQFAELFMDMLLYDYPLTTTNHNIVSWKGFGDDNNSLSFNYDSRGNKKTDNDLWSPELGAFNSRKLGATWHHLSTPEKRGKDLDSLTRNQTLQLRTTIDDLSFNPYLASQGEEELYKPLNDPLLAFDQDFSAHPNVAYNYIVQDWDKQGDGSQIIENGKVTFFINADYNGDGKRDWLFNPTTDYLGHPIPAEPVNANDFAFALQFLDYLNATHQDIGVFRGHSVDINHWAVNSTVFPYDTLTFFLNRSGKNSLYALNHLYPLPSHILSTELHFSDGHLELPFTSYSPFSSLEWSHYFSIDGLSTVGSMRLESIDKGVNYRYISRDDYPFPNEWDSEVMYQTYKNEFDQYLEQNDVNRTLIPSLSHFAPHLNIDPPKAYFWNTEDENLKATDQNINHLIYRIIHLPKNAANAFSEGLLDILVISSNSIDKSFYQSNELVIKSAVLPYSPILLVFNVLNEHLKQRDVRYAIASGIDKDEMIRQSEQGVFPLTLDSIDISHDSPVWRYHDYHRPPEFTGEQDEIYWYNDEYKIEYDFDLARDLLLPRTFGPVPDPRTTRNDVTNKDRATQELDTIIPPFIVSSPVVSMLWVVLPVIVKQLQRVHSKQQPSN